VPPLGQCFASACRAGEGGRRRCAIGPVSKWRRCGNEAGQKASRGIVFPKDAPKGERHKFTSTILPPYLRRARLIKELLPWLYLKDLSTGDICETLAALSGPDTRGLSASTITRLKAD